MKKLLFLIIFLSVPSFSFAANSSFLATMSVNQSASPNNMYIVQWNQTTFDENNDYSIADSSFIAPEDGFYYFYSQVLCENPENSCRIQIYVNTTAMSATIFESGPPTTDLQSASTMYYGPVSKGDKVTVVAGGFGPSMSDFNHQPYYSFFTGHRVFTGEIKTSSTTPLLYVDDFSTVFQGMFVFLLGFCVILLFIWKSRSRHLQL